MNDEYKNDIIKSRIYIFNHVELDHDMRNLIIMYEFSHVELQYDYLFSKNIPDGVILHKTKGYMLKY